MDFLVSTSPACHCLPHPWLLIPAAACSLSHIPTLPPTHPGLNLSAELVLVTQLQTHLKHKVLLAPSLNAQSGVLHLPSCGLEQNACKRNLGGLQLPNSCSVSVELL